MNKSEILKEAEKVFGFVPGFISEGPENELGPMWGLFKNLVTGDTVIPGKYKALIAVGTAAAIHDRYRLYLDTELARSQGVSAGEIREAISKAGEVSLFSTWMNGFQYDWDTFKRELLAALEVMKQGKPLPVRGRLETREEVYRDIEAVFGAVPGFFREIPDVALGHMWSLLRGVSLEEGLIPPKYKELIGLAVASAINCRYCIFFHTEVSKALGASEAEIKESILLAARTRNFGTMIYGTQYDLETFKKESRKMVDALRKRVPAGVR